MFNGWRRTVISLGSWRVISREAAGSGDPAQMTLVWMIALGSAAMLMLMVGLALAAWLALGVRQPQDGLQALLAVLAISGLITPPLLAWVLIRRVQRLGAAATSQLNESLAETLEADDAAPESPLDLPSPSSAGFDDLSDVIRRLHGLDESPPQSVDRTGAEPSTAFTQLARRCLEISTEIAALQGRETQSRLRMAQSIDRIEGLTFQTVSLALQSGLQGHTLPLEPSKSQPDEIRQLARRALEAARDIHRMVEPTEQPGAVTGARLRLAIELDRLLELMGQPVDEPVQRRLESLNRQLGQQAMQAVQETLHQEQQSERLDKVISAFELLVQTQQAAWQARHIIASARDRARDCG